MKRIAALSMLLFALALCFGTERGTTQKEIDVSGAITGILTPSTSWQNNFPVLERFTDLPVREEWMPVETYSIDTILRAGQQTGIQYTGFNNSLSEFTSSIMLTQGARAAVQKSPVWMRADLENVLNQLDANKQEIWADIINTAVDPYIDEIAFSIAHSSVIYLASNLADPTLFVENAVSMYEIDGQLPYVQIINHGSSTSNPEYYSSTLYTSINADSQLVQLEVPRDIYYWYIVHPKITDEIPAYIDPSVIESNSTHYNNIAPPPDGQFWRNFMFSVQEGNYPVLSDTLTHCMTLFNRNGVGGDAIRAIQWWINSTMNFNSNSERPHQPVRIYRKHMGRCGEYADYTAAASRAALIPATSILSASTDHTWNEFWDNGWVQWEPVNGYINAPLVYENGWGKVFGSVFEIRSDGYLTNVTDRYSSGNCLINFHVVDSLGIPVDGVRLIIAIMDAGTNRFDTAVFTDNNGNVSIPVGDNRQYSVRLESAIGWYPMPVGTYLLITDNSVAGETYDFEIEMPYAKSLPHITPISIPDDPQEDWRIMVGFASFRHLISGVVAWDDIDALGTQPLFYKDVYLPGKVNLLMTDPDNILFYQMDHTCSAFNVLQNVSSGTGLFNIPQNYDFYAFLDNSQVANAQHITGVITYEHFGVGNDDDALPVSHTTLQQIYPNPFSDNAVIRFNLSKDSALDLAVYNVKGQLVKELYHGFAKSGQNSLVWDGTDFCGNQTGNGIYYLSLSTGKHRETRKLLRLH